MKKYRLRNLDYLKDLNFAGFSFERAPLDPIFRYGHYADRVEYEFLDPELESARGEFVDAARRFSRLVSQNTWPTHLTGWSTVPPEWEETQRDRFDRVVTDIHESANAIERAYARIDAGSQANAENLAHAFGFRRVHHQAPASRIHIVAQHRNAPDPLAFAPRRSQLVPRALPYDLPFEQRSG